MKVVKFREHLVPLILSGEKTSTWRLFDDKNLSVGDLINLQAFGKDKFFAKAKITAITEKLFADLTTDDKTGHESFASDDEMYATYSEYYKTPVSPRTAVKIIHFELT